MGFNAQSSSGNITEMTGFRLSPRPQVVFRVIFFRRRIEGGEGSEKKTTILIDFGNSWVLARNLRQHPLVKAG